MFVACECLLSFIRLFVVSIIIDRTCINDCDRKNIIFYRVSRARQY